MRQKIDAPEINDLQLLREYKNTFLEWQSNLSSLGVKFPRRKPLKSVPWPGATLQLLILHKYMGDFVSKEGLAELAQYHNNRLKRDQQARHLGTQRGFNVLCGLETIPETGEVVPRGYYMLVNMTETKPGFCLPKRDAATPPPKYADGTPCSTCSAIQGQPHPKYPTQMAKMEAGHRDPTKPLLGDNVMPQCQDCNKTTKDSIIWGPGEHPLPIALNSPTLVKKSSPAIRKAIYDTLQAEFGGSE